MLLRISSFEVVLLLCVASVRLSLCVSCRNICLKASLLIRCIRSSRCACLARKQYDDVATVATRAQTVVIATGASGAATRASGLDAAAGASGVGGRVGGAAAMGPRPGPSLGLEPRAMNHH